MFCHKCGFELPDGSRFCPNCGVPVAGAIPPTAPESPAEIPPGEEKTKLVSERPSRPAAQLGRVRRVVTVVTLVFLGLLAAVLALVYSGVLPPLADWQQPGGRKISATENAALWGEANAALGGFVGEGIKAAGISGPWTREDATQLSQWFNNFHKVVSQLRNTTPPDEQAPMHRALLPIYEEM